MPTKPSSPPAAWAGLAGAEVVLSVALFFAAIYYAKPSAPSRQCPSNPNA